MNRRCTLALILALFALRSAWGAQPWPEIPSPPKAHVEWVGDSMRVNGVPTRIMQFQSRVGREEIVEYYRAYWSGGYPTKPSITPLGTATVISQRHGPFFMTVKVEDAGQGTSRGLISVAQVAGSKITRDPGELPVMPGAQVFSVVESDDPGKHSRAVVILAPQPPASVSQFYEASFGNAGWHQVQVNESLPTPGSSPGSFMVFDRDASEMQLSIVETRGGRGSTLVANLVTKDTGPGGD